MQTVDTIDSLVAVMNLWRESGSRIALVPTMGNLHQGHLQLVDFAKRNADRVVVSIFVNPTQFTESEDYQGYPRVVDEDSRKLYDRDTDLVFIPNASEIYPQKNSTFVEVRELSHILCGEFRPTHFRGVTTIACKLLNIVRPDVAVFGEKDFQQLFLIRSMVADLNMLVEITGVATVREEDGLAMSSRNQYLTADERKTAILLYQSLVDAKENIENSNREFREIESQQMERLRAAGFRPDYFSIRRSADLEVASKNDKQLVLLTAAWLGRARLIDNLPFQLSANSTPSN